MLLIGAFVLAGGLFGRLATGATLAQLFGGGSLNVGDSQFSDWDLVSSDSTAATIPDLSRIEVTPLASDLTNPGLQFIANGQLSVSGVNSIDLTFKFRVQTLAGGNTFINNTVDMPGIRFGGSGGLAFVSNDITSGAGDDLAEPLVVADATSSPQSVNPADFAPQSSLFVSTNVLISGMSETDAVELAIFTQTFSQTGPAVLAGDYNQDGVVDTADYVVWRAHLGAPAGSLPNDVDGGIIGQAQYNTWLAKLGNTEASLSPALEQRGVSESASWLLLVLAMTGSLLPWRREYGGGCGCNPRSTGLRPVAK
jgi:hypothetical protein